MTSLKRTNVIGRKCKRQIILLNSVCAIISPTKCLLEKEDLEKNKSGILFDYVKCDIELPENLVEIFVNFPPIVRNISVGRNDLRPFMRKHSVKEGLLIQTRRTLISIYFLENGTIITPLLLFNRSELTYSNEVSQ